MTHDTPPEMRLGNETEGKGQRVFVPRLGPRSIDELAIEQGEIVQEDSESVKAKVFDHSTGIPQERTYKAEDLDRLNFGANRKALEYLFKKQRVESGKVVFGTREVIDAALQNNKNYQRAAQMINAIGQNEPETPRWLADYFTEEAKRLAGDNGIEARKGSLAELAKALDKKIKELGGEIDAAEEEIEGLTKDKQAGGKTLQEVKDIEFDIYELHRKKEMATRDLQALDELVKVFGMAEFYEDEVARQARELGK